MNPNITKIGRMRYISLVEEKEEGRKETKEVR